MLMFTIFQLLDDFVVRVVRRSDHLTAIIRLSSHILDGEEWHVVVVKFTREVMPVMPRRKQVCKERIKMHRTATKKKYDNEDEEDVLFDAVEWQRYIFQQRDDEPGPIKPSKGLDFLKRGNLETEEKMVCDCSVRGCNGALRLVEKLEYKPKLKRTVVRPEDASLFFWGNS